MSIIENIRKLFVPKIAYAHCDIPCGIYDPHASQVAAHTVLRMVDLINELPKPTPDMTPEKRQEFVSKLARYTAVKEQHAEIVKHELRILWADYFKPEHLQASKDLHELFWKSLKLASKAKQEVNVQAAEELLGNVQKIAEIFWKTKNVETVKRKSFYITGREIVYPKV